MLSLLTDPFLQLPTDSSVRVVWFTAWQGDRHWVEVGEDLARQVVASSQKITLKEDGRSHWYGAPELQAEQWVEIIDRPVWRHEAVVTDLRSGERSPYRVVSRSEAGTVWSDSFHLSPLPSPEKSLKILLTSDHQMMPMVPQTLQCAVQEFGQFDAVFYAGDLVNVPDRASEWFDDRRGRSFFPCFQGRAIASQFQGDQAPFEIDPEIDRITSDEVNTRYGGGAILQNTPIFPCIGNHEVMGMRPHKNGLNGQFGDPIPRFIQTKNPDDQRWIDQELKTFQKGLREGGDRPFSTDTYESIFSLPDDGPGGKRYYATTFGPVRLISLEATNVWRWFRMEDHIRGRYQERVEDLETPENWGGGQFIFESIQAGSTQHQWLQEQLEHPEFKAAKYRIVMFHHPPHSLGQNIVPPYTDPLQEIRRDQDNQISAIRYHYNIDQDYLIKDVVPLLEKAGVDLVYFGHCHLWNRFEQSTDRGTLHFLESSHAGNTHGAAWGDRPRKIPDELQGDRNYTAIGDPNGLMPVIPTINPLLDPETQEPLPYVAHQQVGVFSVLDTATGEVSSYRYDSGAAPVKFDQFKLG